jgi:hypothetical protein
MDPPVPSPSQFLTPIDASECLFFMPLINRMAFFDLHLCASDSLPTTKAGIKSTRSREMSSNGAAGISVAIRLVMKIIT